MKVGESPERWRPWLLVLLGWGAAFVLACRLSVALPEEAGGEMAARVMGDGRRAVSVYLTDTAELYFHGGVDRQAKRAITNDWFQRGYAEVSPRFHRHAEGSQNLELLPWLQMAMQADPHNVDTCLMTAFWLATGVRRPDLAIQVLAEAQRNNPHDYRIPQEQGRMAIHEGQLAAGLRKMEAALTRWPNGSSAEDRQALLDKAEILTLLGFLYEDAGLREKASDSYKNTLAIFPQRAYIRNRLAVLEAGEEPEPKAREALALLVRRTTQHICAEETEDHEGHRGHDHDQDSGGETEAH